MKTKTLLLVFMLVNQCPPDKTLLLNALKIKSSSFQARGCCSFKNVHWTFFWFIIPPGSLN